MGIFDAALLAAAVGIAAPLLLAAMGEIVSERAGVFNVGMEGMILMGAFFGYFVAAKSGSLTAGVFGGAAAGAFLAVLMAAISIEFKADQIVTGVGLLLLAVGLSAYLYEKIFTVGPETMDTMKRVPIPGLSELGGAGRALFDQQPLVYLAFLMVPVTSFLLYRTQWGITIRAVGETPRAADAAGVSVRRVQWGCTTFAGAMGGFAGTYLALGQIGTFTENMSGGRGFLVLAAVLFGRWRPRWVLASCILFAVSDALQLRLQAVGSVPGEVWLAIAAAAASFGIYSWSKRHGITRVYAPLLLAGAGIALVVTEPRLQIASQLWLVMPYLLALIVLAGSRGQTRIPTHLGLPYHRSEGS